MKHEIKTTLAKNRNLKHFGSDLFVEQTNDVNVNFKLRGHLDKLAELSEEFKKKSEEEEDPEEDASEDDMEDDSEDKSKDNSEDEDEDDLKEKPKKFKKSDGDNHQVEMFIT